MNSNQIHIHITQGANFVDFFQQGPLSLRVPKSVDEFHDDNGEKTGII
jgi:hypothetical protein